MASSNPVRRHKFVLSHQSDQVDKELLIQSDWPYSKFIFEVKKLFPNLKESFELFNADFKGK